jgi:hypothetical protein
VAVASLSPAAGGGEVGFLSGESVRENDGPVGFTAGHHFTATGDADLREMAESATAPLSVIVQVTKRCDFGCVFCSETPMMPNPTVDQLDAIRANLVGVQRSRSPMVTAQLARPRFSRQRWFYSSAR